MDSKKTGIFGKNCSQFSRSGYVSKNFTEVKYNYGSKDIRFTTKENKVYATVLAWPEENEFDIKSLGSKTSLNDQLISSVTLLGFDDELSWEQHPDKLTIQIPGRQPTPFAHSFQIEFN